MKNLIRSGLIAATLVTGQAMASAPSKMGHRAPAPASTEATFEEDYAHEAHQGPQRMHRPAREKREPYNKVSRSARKKTSEGDEAFL